jgi:hypothetical protein
VRFVNVSELTALGVGDPTTATDSPFLDRYFTPDRGVVSISTVSTDNQKLLFDIPVRIVVNGWRRGGFDDDTA